MAPSDERRGRRRLRCVGAVLLAGGTVSGCVTTQDEAARLQLNAARIRAGELRTVVRVPGTRLHVRAVSVLSAPHESVFVVRVDNPGPTALADLPISVGLHARPSGRIYLNVHSPDEQLAYFDSHLPTVEAGRSLTWVDTVTRSLAHGARPFALVGDRAVPAVTRAGKGRPPVCRTWILSETSSAGRRARLRIRLRNATSVPQFQLQVYAIAVRGGRDVAAGDLTVPALGGNATGSYTLPMIGHLAHARLKVTAVPTIFR